MIADVAEELREVARSSDDAVGYFAAMYARVTSHIATSIAQGRFDDGERMERFATTFAGYYTRGLGPAPVRAACWEASFAVAGRRDLLVLQQLLIGINAHVNHDLPQATVDVARAGGGLASVKADFDAINDLLAAMTKDLLRDLDRVSRWAGEAGLLGGGRLFNFSLRKARDQAWDAAQRLYAMGDDERAAEAQELDRLVTVLAYLVSEPAPPMKLLVRLVRRLEEQDPRLVTAALLGDRSRRRP